MENTKIATCILFCGFLIGFYSGAGINSAQDLLQNSFVPTSTLLSVIGGVFAVCNVVSTWFGVRKGSEPLKILLCSFMVFVGTLSSALVFNIYAKLICLVFAAIGLGVLDILYVSFASLHHESGVSAYSAGMGIGVFVGSVYYTGFTTGFCIPFTQVYMIAACMSFFFIVLFFLLNPEQPRNMIKGGYTLIKSVRLSSHVSQKEEINLVKRGEKSENKNESEDEVDVSSDESEEDQISHSRLSWTSKYSVLKENFLSILFPFAISTLAEYISFQSISTTLAFDNSPFEPKDHYEFYTLFFFFGLLLFRAHPFFIMAFCSSWAEKLRVRQIWIFSVAQVICTVFLLFCSLYRFLPSVMWVLAVIFIHGCLGGMAYVESLLLASETSEPDFAAALVESAYQVNVMIAALLGLSFEHFLVNHCLQFYESQGGMQELCYTRSEGNMTSSCG